MDLVMPGMNGAEAAKEIMRRSPCPILVVTATVAGNYALVCEALGNGAFDAIATPLGAPEPGVLVHWTAYANLMQGDFLEPVARPVAWAVALLVIVALVLAGRAGVGLRSPSLVAAAAAVLAVAGSVVLFFAGAWFAPALPVAAASIAFTAVAVESFRVERARKQEIQGWFGAYVSPAVVRRLLADPQAIELGGELRDLTILFSDIAGFTT